MIRSAMRGAIRHCADDDDISFTLMPFSRHIITRAPCHADIYLPARAYYFYVDIYYAEDIIFRHYADTRCYYARFSARALLRAARCAMR